MQSQLETDQEATWRYLREATHRCPFCKSKPQMHEILHFLPALKDGQVWCNYCWTYMGIWDEIDHEFIYDEERMRIISNESKAKV